MRKLAEWKQSTHKPLLILGARQTGKTWLMETFGKEHYENAVHIELENSPEMQEIFKTVTDPLRIIRMLEIYSGKNIDPENSLLILDEIQEVPKALSALKFFNEKAPEFHIMAAGSYLGTNLHRSQSFPVGKVEVLHLKPMSFTEFLLACGQKGLADFLEKRSIEDAQIFADRFNQMLRYYYFVGGMPEAVQTFVQTQDLSKVRQVQNMLLSQYRADFSKHIPGSEIPQVNMVWDSVPVQLAKENRKFVYSQMKSGARSKEFETAIQWLCDTGLLHRVFRIEKPYMPLSAYEDPKAFKLYFLDIGLLGAMAGLQEAMVLSDSIFFTEFKGALSEQFVLQELTLQTEFIFYWFHPRSTGEVDFVIQADGRAWPLEVKSGKNVQSKSLKAFLEKYNLPDGLRLSLLPYKKQDWLINYPLYFAGQILAFIAPPAKTASAVLPLDISSDVSAKNRE